MAARLVVDPALEAVVESFGTYQLKEKRLAELSVQMSSYQVRAFLAWRERAGRGDLGGLAPEELSEFVIDQGARLKPSSMRGLVPTLRRFVRFLYATGVVERDLSAAVPSVPTSRFSGLPKGVDPATLAALIDSCAGAASGRRDLAILTLMWRMGLRAVEIARMTLDDIDWRTGEILVRGKGGRLDRLPLPGDVGEVLVDYLRNTRPHSASRSVFISARDPEAGMSRNAVVFVSRTASQRAGTAMVGGHRLRHTAATSILRAGGSLREVGQVMRHNDVTTTAIYAKVDQRALSMLVRAWPERASR